MLNLWVYSTSQPHSLQGFLYKFYNTLVYKELQNINLGKKFFLNKVRFWVIIVYKLFSLLKDIYEKQPNRL